MLDASACTHNDTTIVTITAKISATIKGQVKDHKDPDQKADIMDKQQLIYASHQGKGMRLLVAYAPQRCEQRNMP